MWTLVDREAVGQAEAAPVGSVIERGAVHALILDLRPPDWRVDGVVPVPGCDPRTGGHGRYWLSGEVGGEVRRVTSGRIFGRTTYLFLLTVGDLQFVGHLVAPSRRVKIRPRSRISVKCVFAVPSEQEREHDDLPAEWSGRWQVLGHTAAGELGTMLDLEPPVEDGRAGRAEHSRRTPLLLDTDYGGGPLWYRSADDRGPWGLGLDHFPLSETLRDRLLRWTAADHHLHDDYEDDDPEHEAAWHEEGLALLADLRSELGPAYDIKFSHDLDA